LHSSGSSGSSHTASRVSSATLPVLETAVVAHLGFICCFAITFMIFYLSWLIRIGYIDTREDLLFEGSLVVFE